MTGSDADEGGGSSASRSAGTAALMLGALGVVFGDIGTSPLYALRSVFSSGHQAVTPDKAGVYGVISLVFWTITLVVSVKYVTFIMRADNQGEGGIMALIALVQERTPRRVAAASGLVALGILGASLFYGDGIITPAISVLSAIEGVQIAAPSVSSLVVPMALVVLVLLFAVQRFGTGAMGWLFGPIMGLWFAAIAVCGLGQVAAHPGIIGALSPTYGATFLVHHLGTAFVALASVVLTITGAEALYADLGHFGRPPIRRAWFLIVFPALTVNYMGQGALVLHSSGALRNPFYVLVPHWGRIPMVVLATAATVIASQAVISGTFSITHQAVQLGFLPRLTIRHTSEHEAGQVYAPGVNWALCVAVAAVVVGFGSSNHLASAYGVAVTGTMVVTTVLFLFVVRTLWGKPWWLVLAGAAAFLTVDLTFFSATLTKIGHGGWLPLSIALAVFTILSTWRRGRELVGRRRIEKEGPLRGFVEEVRAMDPPVQRVPGTAVFLTASEGTTPLALRANVEHNHVVHKTLFIVTIQTLNIPRVNPSERLVVDDLGYRDDGITRLTARVGYQDRFTVPQAIALARRRGGEAKSDESRPSYFVTRITLACTKARGMARWRKRLFIAMWRNGSDPTAYFGLPDERTVTMGSVIEL